MALLGLHVFFGQLFFNKKYVNKGHRKKSS